MPPLAGMVDLTANPMIDRAIGRGIGNDIGETFAQYRLNKEKKRKQIAEGEMMKVLMRANREKWDGNRILEGLYSVPNATESEIVRERIQTQELYNQQRAIQDERGRYQQEVAQLRADNQYNMLLAKIDASILTEEQKQAGRMELNQARLEGRLDEIASRFGYQSDLQGQKAADQSMLQTQRDTSAGQRQDKSLAAKQSEPKYFRGADGVMYEYRPAQARTPEISNYPQQAINFTDKAFSGVANNMVNEVVDSTKPPQARPIPGMPAKTTKESDLSKKLKDQISFWQRERSDAFLNDDTARYNEADKYIRQLEAGYIPQKDTAAPVQPVADPNAVAQPAPQTQQAAPGAAKAPQAQNRPTASVPQEEMILTGDDGKPSLRAPKPPVGQVLIEKDGQFFFIPEEQAEDAQLQGYGVYR